MHTFKTYYFLSHTFINSRFLLQTMVLVSNSDLPVYYKEESESARTSRFCLKPVRTLQPRGERKPDAINVQVRTTYEYKQWHQQPRVGKQLLLLLLFC